MTSNRIRIGVVGLNFGRHIVDELLKEPASRYFELAAVCDMDRPKADALAKAKGVKAYYSLKDLLADPTIPAVGLYTGPVGRADLLGTIIRAGKDVMTTKPFEIDADKGLAVLHEAIKIGRTIHLNSPSPTLTEDLLQVKKWREEFNLGRPIGCRIEVWVSYREQANGSWYDDPRLCPVAPIYRLGIYLINDLVRLIGPAEKVAVVSSRIFTGRPTADNGQLSILFANGAIGNVFASFCVDDGQFYSNTMVLNCERGTIYRNVGPSPYGTHGGGKMQVVAKTGEQQTAIHETTVNEVSGGYQWHAFYRAIHGEKLPDLIVPEDIIAGVRLINAMQRSEASGQIEKV